MDEPEEHQRRVPPELAREMNAQRTQLRLRWTEVARLAGMSVQNLLRIRNGEINVTSYAQTGLEQALNWPSGYLDGKLVGAAGMDNEADLTDEEKAIVRATLDAWTKEYGRKKARQMVNEVLAEVRESSSDAERPEGERGAG